MVKFNSTCYNSAFMADKLSNDLKVSACAYNVLYHNHQ